MKPKAQCQLWGANSTPSDEHGLLGRGSTDSATVGVRLLLSHSWAQSGDRL